MKFIILSFALLWTFLFHVSQAQAFINIESLRQNLKKGFYGSSGLQLAGASGNTDTFKTGFNSQNILKNQKREYILITNYNYGEASQLKNQNKGNFHLRYAQRFSTDWSWEAFSQVEFNEFQSLSLRSLAGGGFRARLIHSTESSLFLGLGTFYEDETIEIDSDQANFRGNIYLSYRNSIKKDSELVIISYYQPSYKRINDYRLQLSLGLEFKLNQFLSIVNQFELQFDSAPPIGIEKEDISYSVGLNLSY